MRNGLRALGVIALFLPAVGGAQGINTNVALAVAEDEAIFRSQLRYRRATDDPTGADRGVDAVVLPQTLVYGVTPRWTAFATLPVLALRKFQTGDGRVNRDSAVGDLRLLARYTILADDYAPLSTRRLALLAGMKFPTGATRFGSPSFDPILGLVGTWAANRHEFDLDALYTITTERRDVEVGDAFVYDLAYRYRLWPGRFAGRLLQLNGVLELNGRWTARARVDGNRVSSSGGAVLLLSPGAQFITSRFIVEASFQIPIWQDLNGSQLEEDFTAVLSVRVPFDVGLR